MKAKKIIQESILAGILIGFGVLINLQYTPPHLGALFFSFGLITIIQMQLKLFTGKIGFFSHTNEIPALITILLFNFIGIITIVGLYALANKDFVWIIQAAACNKFTKSIFTLFINGCLCGMLIHFAVKNKKVIITSFAVIIFILIGAEHCIADFPYLLFNFSLINFIKFLSIVLGNSLGAILIERLNQ